VLGVVAPELHLKGDDALNGLTERHDEVHAPLDGHGLGEACLHDAGHGGRPDLHAVQAQQIRDELRGLAADVDQVLVAGGGHAVPSPPNGTG
jgi:hypothetical protein